MLARLIKRFFDENENNFIQVEVKKKCEILPYRGCYFRYKINNIIVNTHPTFVLPYCTEDLLNPQKNEWLLARGIIREPLTRVVLRGDDRNIQKIREIGGFHPKCTSFDNSDDQAGQPLDVRRHRYSANRSGFVSTTVSQKVAHEFGCAFSQKEDLQDSSYTIYSLLATGAMTPSRKDGFDEMEYSVPGGIDYEGIVAYRECSFYKKKDRAYTKCSDIFFNKRFGEKYPHLIDDVLRTQLVGNETLRQYSEDCDNSIYGSSI